MLSGVDDSGDRFPPRGGGSAHAGGEELPGDERASGGNESGFPAGDSESRSGENANDDLTQSAETPAAPVGGTVEPAPALPQRRLAASTAFFSLATGLSRIAGMGREIVAANYFGVRGPMSAFTIAFQVPNLIRSLFADAALQAAFVPVFTEQLVKGNRREAFRLASTLFFVVLLVIGSLTALFILLAPVIMPLFAPGFNEPLQDLTIHLAQLLFPIVLLLGLSGLIVGVLNSFEHFSVPAIAPLFWNLVIILTMVVAVPHLGGQDRIYAYAVGVLAGTVVQLLLPLPWLRRTGFRLSLSIDWRDSRVWKVLKLMLPVTLGLGLINFNLSVDSIFGTLISDEAPAAIDKAFRVYMLPQGVFAVAVATVLFPRLSRFAAHRDFRGLVSTLANGNRQLILLLVPAAAAILVLAEPITRVIYQRGEFDPAQTELVSKALFFFAFALPFAGVNLMLIRAFFSLQRPWVPTTIAAANLAVNAGLDAVLYKPLGIGGIPLSTAIVSAVTTVCLAWILRRQLGRLEGRQTAETALRIGVAAAALAGATWGVWHLLEPVLGPGFGGGLLGMLAAMAAGGVVYGVAVLALRVHEASQIVALVRGGFRALRPES